jgi:hypothetical protein
LFEAKLVLGAAKAFYNKLKELCISQVVASGKIEKRVFKAL